MISGWNFFLVFCYASSGGLAGVWLCKWLIRMGVMLSRVELFGHPLGLGLIMLGWVLVLPAGRFEAVTMVLPLYLLAIMDFKTLQVEPWLIAISLVSRLLWLGLEDGGLGLLLDGLTGALLGAGGLFLVGFFYRWLRGRAGLGEGDAAVLAAIGVHVGVLGIWWVVLVSSSLALLVGPFWLLLQRKPLWGSPLPFALFLGAGGVLVRFFQLHGGGGLLNWLDKLI